MAEIGCSEWKPVLAMVAVDVAFAIVNVLIKKVLDEGTSILVLTTYRLTVAAVFLAPVAYLKERKTRPKITAHIFLQLFFTALFGVTFTQFLFLLGLKYTSATFACAFINMVPVATFVMALPFGLETANLKTKAGRAKVLGTCVSVSGAMVLTLYKGIALTHISHTSTAVVHAAQLGLEAQNNRARKWTIGSMALVGGCLSWSSWYLLQAKISKSYPVPYSNTAMVSVLSALQSAAMGVITQRDLSLWALNGKLQIITVLFSGIVGSGLGFVVMSWCVKKKGPLFTAAFSPLIQIIVAIIDFSVLREQIHLGSVLGSVLLIAGLYILLWGKNMDAQSCMVPKQVQSIEDGEVQP